MPEVVFQFWFGQNLASNCVRSSNYIEWLPIDNLSPGGSKTIIFNVPDLDLVIA
jgi:hypothetical protein